MMMNSASERGHRSIGAESVTTAVDPAMGGATETGPMECLNGWHKDKLSAANPDEAVGGHRNLPGRGHERLPGDGQLRHET
jgi:hypothetical protein